MVWGGAPLFEGVPVEPWLPDGSWQFGIGASTSAWTDAHRIDALALRVGSFVETAAADVEVLINGQQYSRTGAQFTYFPPPVVSWVLPTNGPVGGGTMVLVAGLGHFKNDGQLFCRFNDTVVPATFFSTHAPALAKAGASGGQRRAPPALPVGATLSHGAGVLCRTPSWPTAAAVPIALSFNAQQYTETGAAFDFYEPPRVISLEPTAGPAEGGTRVLVSGTGLLSGSRATSLCAFGEYRKLGMVAASMVDDVAAICITPRLPRIHTSYAAEGRGGGGGAHTETPLHRWALSAPVELSVNQQNFTSDGVNHLLPAAACELRGTSHTAQPTAAPSSRCAATSRPSAWPLSLPRCGRASDANPVRGQAASGNGTEGIVVNATRVSQDALLCRTVAGLPVGPHPILVSLNGQDFVDSNQSVLTYPTEELRNIAAIGARSRRHARHAGRAATRLARGGCAHSGQLRLRRRLPRRW